MAKLLSESARGGSGAATPSCPVCHQRLSGFVWNHVEVDICRNGCGTWFDYGELAAIEQSDTLENIDAAFEGTYAPRPVDASMQDPDRSCPRHGVTMDRFEWNVGSGIVMDSCPQCEGTWLDAGELEGFAALVKSHRESPPEIPPELREKLLALQLEGEANFDAMLDTTVSQTVRWDFLFFDDMLRALMKRFIKSH